jgi:hypothetical protein
MNGAREGSHTDAAASQVHHFTQPVFDAEGKSNHFIVLFWAFLRNNPKEALMYLLKTASSVLFY